MMRSMFSGVSSLRVHQTRMDVIANNIANVNTIGFKSQRATFQDAFYQRIQGATGPDPLTGRAGTNPQQIGLGLNLGSIDNIMTQGASQRTDNPLDLMLTGPGFFIVQTDLGNAFTRAGNVNMDRNFNLHINGLKLMGWNAVDDGRGGFEIQRELQPLDLSRVRDMDAQATSIIEMVGNLNAEGLDMPEEGITRTLTIFDSLGTAWTKDVIFRFHPEPSGAGTSYFSFWTYEFVTNADGNVLAWQNNIRGDDVTPGELSIGAGETGGGGVTGTIAFDRRGRFVAHGAADADPAGNVIPGTVPGVTPTDPEIDAATVLTTWTLTIEPHPSGDTINPSANFGRPNEDGDFIISVDTRALFQRADTLSLRTSAMDGNRPGRLADISVGSDGTISGRFTNGLTRIIGQIPIALFDNPAGLERGGSNLWFATTNSGPFDGVGTIGDMQGGALEMSNVDLAAEFTEMITTQRGFQAASRTISVSDEMLQELVNLRR